MSSKPFCEKSSEVLDHIDPTKPVFVYRNLHKKCLSVRQGGIVKCHAENVVLMDCEFKVSIKGRDRVRKEGKKNVHAGIKGMVVDARRSLEPCTIIRIPANGGNSNQSHTINTLTERDGATYTQTPLEGQAS
jgi:hypothetical protein